MVIELLTLVVAVWAFVLANRDKSLSAYLRSVGLAMIVLSASARNFQKLNEPVTWATVMVALASVIVSVGYVLAIHENRKLKRSQEAWVESGMGAVASRSRDNIAV